MSPFWKKFLREGHGLFARRTRPQVWLGAFGKHPGWDDHIDDIGLETESLLLAKQIIYVDGIGGQINSGEWEKLGPTQRLPGFEHVFLWKRDEAFLLGGIWSSRDGKNRTQYPLIICAHCMSIPLDWAVTSVLPALCSIQAQCKSTRRADEVREICRQALGYLRHLVENLDNLSLPRGLKLQEFTERLGVQEDQEGLYRVAYCVHTQLGPYVKGARELGESLAGGQIRLPAILGLVPETLTFWSLFLEFQLGTNVPLLLTLPLQETWVDATCGEPTCRGFYSLRAAPEVLKLASTEECQVPLKFRRRQSDLVQTMMEMIRG
jgi:hypothetical protein